jgi:O-antigen/teichoic acid export membrane protein
MSLNLWRWLGTALTGFLTVAISFLTSILVARLLQPSGRGELAIVTFWPLLFGGLALVGLPGAIVHHAARLSGSAEGSFTAAVAATSVCLSVVAGAVAVLLLPLLIADDGLARLAQIYAALLIPAHVISSCLLAIENGRQRFARANLIRLAPHAGYLFFVWLAFHIFASSVGLAVLAHLGSIVLTLVILLGLDRRLLLTVPDWKAARHLLSTGIHFHGANLMTMLREQTARFIPIALFDPAVIGVYAVAMTFATAPVTMAVDAFATLLLPQSSGERDPERKNAMIARSFRLGATVVAVAAPALIIAAHWLLPFLVGAAYAGAAPIAQILVVATGAQALRMILIAGAQGYGDWRVQTWSEIAGLAVLLLCLLFGAWLGPLTAALALSAASCIALMGAIVAAQARFGLAPSSLWPFTAATILDAAAICGSIVRHVAPRGAAP